MTIVGFSFHKINIERKETTKGAVNINNNVSIKNIKKADINLADKKQEGLNFSFEFTSKYTPELATMLMEGEIIYIQDQKKAKEILEKWKQDKKVDPEVVAPVLNAALNKCNIKALVLSEDLNLPPPVPLPRINIQKDKGGSGHSYIG